MKKTACLVTALLTAVMLTGCALIVPTQQELSSDECISIVECARGLVDSIGTEGRLGFYISDGASGGIFAVRSNKGEWKRLRIGSEEIDTSDANNVRASSTIRLAGSIIKGIKECYEDKLYNTPHNDPKDKLPYTIRLDLTDEGLSRFSNVKQGVWKSGEIFLICRTETEPVSIEITLTDSTGNNLYAKFGSIYYDGENI